MAWPFHSRATDGRYARSVALNRSSRHRDLSPRVLGPLTLARIQRGDEFGHIVDATVSYLKHQWPEDLATLQVEVAGMPDERGSSKVPRWSLNRQTRTIRIYRHPIERLTKLHRKDRWHTRVMIESVVFSAVAEMLGTDPWQLAPERFHPH